MATKTLPLTSWDTAKQQQYRVTHGATLPVFHILLDASGSMVPHAHALRGAYNRYLAWLKQHAPALSSLDVRCFHADVASPAVTTLHSAQPLTEATYQPEGGTALYEALITACEDTAQPGQHILLVFTDGVDSYGNPITQACARDMITRLRVERNGLCIFLGAFPEALAVGMACGFAEGNCLIFSSEKIPEAFQRLTDAMQRYLAAPTAERRLLAQGGVFA